PHLPPPLSTLFPYTTLFRSKTASILMGSNFADDKGNATLYATFDHAGAILQSKYDYSACSLDASSTVANALACGGSSTSAGGRLDRKSTRLNSSHSQISYAV